MKKRHIGIMTWHYYNNFGSALQAYALQRSICSLGCKCDIINYRNRRFGEYNSKKEFARRLIDQIKISKKYRFPFSSFQAKYLNQTTVEQNPDRLNVLAKIFDAVVCGSDQIWAPNVFNSVYMLDFVPDGISKISYAASIGLNDIPDELADQYKRLLASFHAISVREKQGSQLLEQRCGTASDVVLDPTLLLGVRIWEKVERKIRIKDKFIFCYFLNESHKYQKAVQSYAMKNGINIIGCSANPEDAAWMTVLGNDIGPREFLWLIHHADTVITDSYHAAIFSLLYHKPFIVFERFENSDKICQNSRIYQLDDYFGLSKRIVRVAEDTEIAIDDYDYEIFEQRLFELRQSSMAFLRKALEG